MPSAEQLRNKFIEKIKELFQVDRSDLDFGIYRILRQKHSDIIGYLEKRLPEKVLQELSSREHASIEDIKSELAKAEDQARKLGVDPATVPKVIELRDKYSAGNSGQSEDESELYSRLYTFFSRYYDKGDFLSRPRYKGNTYAIPYDGEEVKLHWANADQYYIKSSEYFRDYRFTLSNGRTVLFKLVEAGTAVNNVKDKDRRFRLAVGHVIKTTDEEGEEIEEDVVPVAIENGELVARFIYVPSEEKQTELCLSANKAIQDFVANSAEGEPFREIADLRPTEKKKERTLLEQKLADYTERNTCDYFIHKNLGAFLRRELDFFIKSEVMNLDDIQNVGSFQPLEKRLRLVQAMRSIAHDLIDFLAQLEDFQKKLWLKKKFVVETNWCITLDRVPKELYAEIARNKKQYEEWEKLGFINTESNDRETAEWLKKNPFLVLDTKFFPEDFKAKLLASIPNLDEQTDGLLIHSENFQALNLLQERYREQVKCIYIDPPYNTGATEIIYKNGYKHSSWNSLITDRVIVAESTGSSDCFFVTAIDHAECFNLGKILDNIYGEEHRLAIITVQHNPKGRNQSKFFSENTEYLLFYARDPVKSDFRKVAISEHVAESFDQQDEVGKFRYENYIRARTVWSHKNKPKNWYPIYVSKNLQHITTEFIEGYHELYPITDQGEFSWKNVKDTFNKLNCNSHFIAKIENGELGIYHKYREQQVLKNIWIDKKYQSEFNGSNLIRDIFGENKFDYPKSIYSVLDIVKLTADKDHSILDYFAGSGTTGHAVINLNREDGGRRKYILVEMGEHFETVLKPRIEKVVYAKDWKDGRPLAHDTGISHCFKYIRLESYEDALNNLKLRRSQEQEELLEGMVPGLKDDYLLHYMLDVEARGSILDTKAFKKPFDYKMSISTGNAGESIPRRIDLVETFNYLIGLRVERVDWKIEEGYMLVAGKTPANENALIIWRDCEKLDYDKLEKLCEKLKLDPRKMKYDVVYVNGDNSIANSITTSAEDGESTLSFKIRLIEDEFLSRMWEAPENAGTR